MWFGIFWFSFLREAGVGRVRSREECHHRVGVDDFEDRMNPRGHAGQSHFVAQALVRRQVSQIIFVIAGGFSAELVSGFESLEDADVGFARECDR